MVFARRIFVLARATSAFAVLAALLITAQVAAAQRASGIVSSVADGVVWLDDGTSFAVGDATRVTVSTPATVEDLQPGRYVAITAQRMQDGTLLASIVNISPNGGNERQSPMGDGNIMTNANIDEAVIDQVVGGILMVTFLGQMDHVVVPPTAQIVMRTDGSIDDIQPGVRISANVADGMASSVTLGA